MKSKSRPFLPSSPDDDDDDTSWLKANRFSAGGESIFSSVSQPLAIMMSSLSSRSDAASSPPLSSSRTDKISSTSMGSGTTEKATPLAATLPPFVPSFHLPQRHKRITATTMTKTLMNLPQIVPATTTSSATMVGLLLLRGGTGGKGRTQRFKQQNPKRWTWDTESNNNNSNNNKNHVASQIEKEGLAAVILCELLSALSILSSWLLPAVAIALTAIYVIYPISVLLLFRISEGISLTRLFENSHQCRANYNLGNCAAVALVHTLQLAPIIVTLIWWKSMKKQQNSIASQAEAKTANSKATHATSQINPLTKVVLVWIIMCLLGMILFKLAVDEWLLFSLSEVAKTANTASSLVTLSSSSLPLHGKVAIVTGANRGIGLATSIALADLGAHVVLTCRSIAKCQPAVDEINNNSKFDDNQGGSASAAVLDLSRLESAHNLSVELKEQYPKIHYIFANAGTTPQYSLTKDGLEDGFGGMHLAHMTLVLGLLPSMQSAAIEDKEPSRVIMVSSEMAINAAIGIFGKEPIFRSSSSDDEEEESSYVISDMEDVHGEITRGDGTLASLPVYGRAKLCNVLFALELNRRLTKEQQHFKNEDDSGGQQQPMIIAHAVHTGAVGTDSSRDSIQNTFRFFPGLATLVGRLYFPLLWRHVNGGARVLLCAALSKEEYILKGGQYLDALCHPFIQKDVNTNYNDFTVKSSKKSPKPSWEIHTDPIYALMEADRKWSERLWNVSIELLKDSPASEVVQYAPS